MMAMGMLPSLWIRLSDVHTRDGISWQWISPSENANTTRKPGA